MRLKADWDTHIKTGEGDKESTGGEKVVDTVDKALKVPRIIKRDFALGDTKLSFTVVGNVREQLPNETENMVQTNILVGINHTILVN